MFGNGVSAVPREADPLIASLPQVDHGTTDIAFAAPFLVDGVLISLYFSMKSQVLRGP